MEGWIRIRLLELIKVFGPSSRKPYFWFNLYQFWIDDAFGDENALQRFYAESQSEVFNTEEGEGFGSGLLLCK